MTQPFGEQPIATDLPEEMVALAAEFGVSREQIEAVHQIIQLTPEIPIHGIAINGQPMGDGIIRVAREYDHQASEDEVGQSMVVFEAAEAQVQLAFVVSRDALAAALTVKIPDVSSTQGPQES